MILSAIRTCLRTKPFILAPSRIINKLPKRHASLEKPEDLDKPFEYLTSNAAKWKARSSRTQGLEDTLWYQPYVVTGSVAIFLIYFCILREESDIDAELSLSLDDRIPGMEKEHLLRIYESYLTDGKDVTEIENKLKDILKKEKLQNKAAN